LSVFSVSLGDSLSSVYSLFVAASFFFKNAASSAFDSIMFLFVTHPYDTGDRIFIDLENLVVKRVGLFATVFIRSDGTETYFFNSQLTSKFIINVRRSGKTFENLTMQVAWTTPLKKLDALEKCLNNWLSTEENRWFEPSTNITLQNIQFQRYLELTMALVIMETGKIGVFAPLAKLHSTPLFNTIVANLVLLVMKPLYQLFTPIPIPKHISQRPVQARTILLGWARHLPAIKTKWWKRLGIWNLSLDSFRHLLIVPLISCVQERARKRRQLWALGMADQKEKVSVFPHDLWPCLIWSSLFTSYLLSLFTIFPHATCYP